MIVKSILTAIHIALALIFAVVYIQEEKQTAKYAFLFFIALFATTALALMY